MGKNEYCYFQAGVAGQRAGVTIVTLGESRNTGAPRTGVRTLAIHVLPKVWSPNGRRNVVAPLTGNTSKLVDLLDDSGCLHVYLYEREVLKLPAIWQDPFSGAVGPEHEPSESNKRADTASVDLWNRPTGAVEKHPVDFTIERIARPNSDKDFAPIRQFWRILEHYRQEPVTDSTARDIPPQGVGVFSRIDWLQESVYRKFLSLCTEALAHRRPRFEPEVDELGFVRGRMVLDKLIDRQATRRTDVVCEFDSLTTDTHLWQVIRAALQRVAMQAKSTDLGEEALGYEATLSDVSVHNAQTLLNERLSPAFMARIPEQQVLAYKYARSILAQQYGFGFDKDPYEAGVITNVKYDTTILWETMLEKAFTHDLPPLEYSLSTLPKFSYIRRLSTNTKILKNPIEIRPGFVVRDNNTHHPVCVLDATYGPLPKDFDNISEDDFNRILQYAYRVGCHAHLVFPDLMYRNTPLDMAYTGSPSGVDFHLGIFSAKFPEPGDKSVDVDVDHIVSEILKSPL